jgi:hypothetical protein
MKLKKKSKKNKQMLDVVEEELEKEEIVMPDNDNIDRSYIKLPLHLDEQHSRDVGRYLHALTQQRNWTRTLLARSQVYVREYKETL